MHSGFAYISYRTRLLVLLALALAPVLDAQELKPEEIYRSLLPSVATLHVENQAGEKFVGTAFLACKPGLAVTAWHVIHDARKVTAKFADGKTVHVLGVVDKNEKRDLALVRLEQAGAPLVKLCVTNPLPGARAYVIGAPKGFDFSISDGLVSQIQTVDGFRQYQVSCPISAGNSGGPIVNDRGEVMGVTSWSKLDAQNLNFAIPSQYLAELNPEGALIAWKELAKLPQVKTPATQTAKKNGSTEGPAKGIHDFKSLVKSAAGKPLRIVVYQDGKEQVFTFTVPEVGKLD